MCVSSVQSHMEGDPHRYMMYCVRFHCVFMYVPLFRLCLSTQSNMSHVEAHQFALLQRLNGVAKEKASMAVKVVEAKKEAYTAKQVGSW